MENIYKMRPISASDNDAVSRLIKSVLEEFNANKPGTAYFDDSTNHLSSTFEIPRSAYWVIEMQGEVIGAGGIYPTDGLADDTCELVKLYIYEEHRGSGLGRLLMEKCFEQAKLFGYQNIYLESMPELDNAVRLYEKMGFVKRNGPLGNTCHFGCSIWMERELI